MKTKRYLIQLAALFVSLWALASCDNASSNGLEVTNSSEFEVQDVSVTITALEGDWKLTEKVDVLAPGKSVRFPHNQNDTKAVVVYTIDGTSYTHTDAYVDLWKGQTWLVSILGVGESKSSWR